MGGLVMSGPKKILVSVAFLFGVAFLLPPLSLAGDRTPTLKTPIRSATAKAAAPRSMPNPIFITVQVPAHAEVWFDGVKTTQTGVRRYIPVPVSDCHNFTHRLRVVWLENDKEAVHSIEVVVRSSNGTFVDLVTPATTAVLAGNSPKSKTPGTPVPVTRGN